MEPPTHKQVQVLRRGPRAGGWQLVMLRHGDVYRVALESFSHLTLLVLHPTTWSPGLRRQAPQVLEAARAVKGYDIDVQGYYWHDANSAADAFDRIAAALSTPAAQEPTDENR